MTLGHADLISNPVKSAPLRNDLVSDSFGGEVASPALHGVHSTTIVHPSTLCNYDCGMSTRSERASTFGAWLDHKLKLKQWKGADLARRLGVANGDVSRWRRGVTIPSPASIINIADELYADADELLALAGHRPSMPRDELERVHARLDPYLCKVRWTDSRFRMIEGILDQFRQDDEITQSSEATDTSPPELPPPGDARRESGT